MKGPLLVHNGSSADDEQQENANAAAKEANLRLSHFVLLSKKGTSENMINAHCKDDDRQRPLYLGLGH